MEFPPVLLLVAATACSMIGRALVFRAAFEISKMWGFAVVCVPFAPMVFRMKYKELAHEGQHWRTATTVFSVLFFAVTGGNGSLRDAWELVPKTFRPAFTERAEPSDFAAQKAAAAAPLATAPAATPAPQTLISPAERIAASQREFQRLGEVYEQLKRQRGYLSKSDQPAIAAYNLEAAKYQSALAAARAEQTQLNALIAAKK